MKTIIKINGFDVKIIKNTDNYSAFILLDKTNQEIVFTKKPRQLLFEAIEEAVKDFIAKLKKDQEEAVKKEKEKLLIDSVNSLLEKNGINNRFSLIALENPIKGLKYSFVTSKDSLYGWFFKSSILENNKNGMRVTSYTGQTSQEIFNAIKDLYDGYLTDNAGRRIKFSFSKEKIYFN